MSPCMPATQDTFALFGMERSTNSKSCVLVLRMHHSLLIDWDNS